MMNNNTQDSINEVLLAREIEPLAVAAWPARDTEMLEGWLLRFSDGYSSRSNSVSTLSFEGTLATAIQTVEAAYRSHGLPAQFQISPASVPVELERTLVARGYRHRTPTFVMIAEASSIATETDDTAIFDGPDADFIRLTLEGSHSPAEGRERLATLARITYPKAYIARQKDGDTVSCGASVVTGVWASVYVMRTSLAHRRQGHGRRVLSGIANWALRQGASRLYLQVDASNAPARALYARAGFRDGYRYRHYFAPQAQT